jgi:hypothetical protein
MKSPSGLAVLDGVRVEDNDVARVDYEIRVEFVVYVVDEEPEVFDRNPTQVGDVGVRKLYDSQVYVFPGGEGAGINSVIRSG